MPTYNIPIKVVNTIVFILRLFKAIRAKYDKKEQAYAEKRHEVEEKIKS